MRLNVITPDGEEHVLQGEDGVSVKETILQANLDILALCGGNCSCGTCHVHVDPDWIESLSEAEQDETELVRDSECYDVSVSRLSCQIKCSPSLDGLRVTIQEDAWCG